MVALAGLTHPGDSGGTAGQPNLMPFLAGEPGWAHTPASGGYFLAAGFASDRSCSGVTGMAGRGFAAVSGRSSP